MVNIVFLHPLPDNTGYRYFNNQAFALLEYFIWVGMPIGTCCKVELSDFSNKIVVLLCVAALSWKICV